MRNRVTSCARRVTNQVWHSDIALVYAAVVLALYLYRILVGGPAAGRMVSWASTNIHNLVSHPLNVLLVSPFVVEDGLELLSLPVLMVAYAVAQHRLGRAPTLVAIAIGHLLATLLVAPLLVSRITKGWLPRSLINADDVGFSYGLACVLGLLTCTIHGRRRWIYVAVLLAVMGHSAILGSPPVRLVTTTFTDVGHTIALLTGFCLAVLPGALARPNTTGKPVAPVP